METAEPEGFMQPTRYRAKCQCMRCGNVYFGPWRKSPPKDDPLCPRKACQAAALEEEVERRARNMAAMIETGRAPGHIGGNVAVRAVDVTAEVVMQDYGMTDLKDNVRAGDAVAPSLPVPQQRAADNYFGGKGAVPVMGSVAPGTRPTMNARQMDRIGRRAIAGAFRNMAVAPTAIAPDATKGQPALRHVGNEPTGRRQ